MIVTPRLWPHLLAGLIACLLLAGWITGEGGFRDGFREASFDVALPRLVPDPPEPAVMVVDIDQASLSALGPWPWPRARLAALMSAITKVKPAAAGIDVLLDRADTSRVDAEGETADAAVAEAARDEPFVFGFAMDDAPARVPVPETPILLRGTPDLPQVWSASSAIGPSPVIAASGSGFGAIVLLPGADGRIRRVPLLVNTGGRLRPGLAVEVLRVGLGASNLLLDASQAQLRIGSVMVPLDPDGLFRLTPTRTDFWPRRTLSAADVMSDPGIRERLAGQVVVIGSSAPEAGGLRVTPASAATPSVQIQADAVERLLRGQVPSRPARVWLIETLAAIFFAMLAAVLVRFCRPVVALVLALSVFCVWSSGAAVAFRMTGLLVDPAGPTLVGLASLGLLSLSAFVETEWRGRALRASFEQRLAPGVVDKLVQSPGLVRLKGEVREITALFTDIEGFTSMTDTADARDLVALLDDYLETVTNVVLAHGGMIEKVVGDSVHAIFNAPLDLQDHAVHAFECAVAIQAAAERVRASTLGRKLSLGRTRIGLETGMVIVGDVGGGRKLDYTAHGTAMNTASRLENANKQFASSICIGPTTAARLDPSRIRPLGTITLRGLVTPIEVYTVA